MLTLRSPEAAAAWQGESGEWLRLPSPQMLVNKLVTSMQPGEKTNGFVRERIGVCGFLSSRPCQSAFDSH